MIKYGMKIKLKGGGIGKVTEVFSQGFNYHTLDAEGNCIKGQKYCLKSTAAMKR